MRKIKSFAVIPTIAAVAFAGLVGSGVSASAQGVLTNGPEGAQPNSLGGSKPHSVKRRYGYRPLTVVRRAPGVAPVVAAPVTVAAPVAGGIIGGPVTAAGTLAGLPFRVLGGVFPAGGPRKGGVTNVRYENAGAEQNKIDEGFVTPVPVDRSGPIYVVENGDPTLSPFSVIGAPIAATGTLVQTPFNILGAAGL